MAGLVLALPALVAALTVVQRAPVLELVSAVAEKYADVVAIAGAVVAALVRALAFLASLPVLEASVAVAQKRYCAFGLA